MDHRHNPIYDHAYMFDDAHPNADVIDGDDGDDDDDDDGDYDYAPAASMEGHDGYYNDVNEDNCAIQPLVWLQGDGELVGFVCGGMERGFLSQKGGGRGRGVKEKSANATNLEVVKDGVVPSVTVAYGNTHNDLNDDPVAMEGQSPSVDLTKAVKTCRGSYPPSPTQGTTPAENTPESIRAISKRFANTTYGFFLEKRVAYLVVANYVRNTWGKFGLVISMFSSSTGLFSFQFSSMDGLNSMLENDPWFIRSHPIILKKQTPDVNLLKEDVGNVLVKCPKNPNLCAGASETKKKKHSQAPKGILVGLKMAFKPNQEYRHVPKKNTANSSSNKKIGVDSTHKVSDSNPFEVLYSVDNHVEMGTNRGRQIWIRTKKFKNLVIDGQDILVDEKGDGDDEDGDYDYAPAALKEDGDDDDGDYDYAPGA
nr:hypothetical protein [Tanacetum cinerariifolium]